MGDFTRTIGLNKRSIFIIYHTPKWKMVHVNVHHTVYSGVSSVHHSTNMEIGATYSSTLPLQINTSPKSGQRSCNGSDNTKVTLSVAVVTARNWTKSTGWTALGATWTVHLITIYGKCIKVNLLWQTERIHSRELIVVQV